jgi:hypothetical protein
MEVLNVYLQLMRHSPDDIYLRNECAAFALRTQRWKVGLDELKLIDDDIDYTAFDGRADFEYLKKKAAAAMAASDGGPG